MAQEASLYIDKILDGRWKIVGLIDTGNFSLVMDAIDLQTSQPVAVKLLKIGHSANADSLLEFEGELNLLTLLQGCDRLVDILGSGKAITILTGDVAGAKVDVPIQVPYIVLEKASGCMAEVLVQLGVIPFEERLRLYRDVIRGVHQMHLRRIANRDLKSENTLVFSSASKSTAKVADLGRARNLSGPTRFIPDAYLTGRGDLRFAPPELLWWQGSNTDECWLSVDLYLLGSVLFELTVGYGLTAVIIPNALSLMGSMNGHDSASRAADFKANLAGLRARSQYAWEIFDSELPASIRPHLSSLLRLLTDPDPRERARRDYGRVAHLGSLEWLLRRVDICLRTLINSTEQADRLAKRRELRSVSA
jgi:serine/threonine protein kinase